MDFEYIDIHCHGYFKDYENDRDEMLLRAEEAGVAMIHVGTGIETSGQAIALAEKHENNFATVGIHPADLETYDATLFEQLLTHEKVVGIGECGLDYFHKPETEATQRNIFEQQIKLAERTDKPLMLHVRNGKHGEDAYTDAHEILQGKNVLGNVHFFAGTETDAKKFLDLGFTLSFTGVITFAKEYESLVRYVPDTMIHAETDAPFVAPVPYRGKRNEPLYVRHVVEKIAEIKGKDIETMKDILKNNAKRMFKI